jgi:hypothetical protein
VRPLAILAGIAFVIVVALIVRAMERYDAREAREWTENTVEGEVELGRLLDDVQ